MTETIYKPTTDTGIFQRRTSLMPEVIAEQFVAASGLSDAQVSWFVRHVDIRTRGSTPIIPGGSGGLSRRGTKGGISCTSSRSIGLQRTERIQICTRRV